MTASRPRRLVDHLGRELATTDEVRAIRAQQAQLATLQARYDAAQTTADNIRHWRHADDLSAATANSLSVRRTLRMRSRYECLENNSFGKGIASTIATDFVSTGPQLQILTEDRTLATRIEAAWRRWSKSVRLVRKLRTARLAKVIDGEAFLLLATNPNLPGRVKLDVRGIEADQISTPGWVDGVIGEAVDGIEFDHSTGTPLRYHLLLQHPGDRGLVLAGGGTWDQKRDVPAAYLIHLFNHDRPGQARGVPETTPALPLFAMLRRFTLATLQSAETAANFSAVLKTQANAFDDESGSLVDPFEGVPIDRGTMAALPYGYELQQFKAEHPTTTYTAFRDALLLEIARCLHVPQYKALGSAAGYNFSSSRMDDQNYEALIESERLDWEIEALDRIFAEWLDEAILSGELDAIPPQADEIPHRWTWRPRRSVNPLQDAHRVTHLIDAGLMTEQQYLHEQAIDPDAHYRQLEAETARRVERLARLATDAGSNGNVALEASLMAAANRLADERLANLGAFAGRAAATVTARAPRPAGRADATVTAREPRPVLDPS